MASLRTLPSSVIPYAKSPVFNSGNIPEHLLSTHDVSIHDLDNNSIAVPRKLLDVHDLKAGTWGRLNIKSGEVNYFLAGDEKPYVRLKKGDSFIILPEEKHYIDISDDAVFFIEFLRKPK